MRKAQKQEMLEMVQTLHQAHDEIKNNIDKKNYVLAQDMLSQCQECAISIGTAIEKLEGEDFVTVSFVEAYCDVLFSTYEELNGSDVNANKIYKNLKKQLLRIENSIKNDVPIRKEVAFFPYKASMWDALESVYLAAKEDPNCDAYCVPIPYYDRNPDKSLGQMHYEGNEYPKNIEIVDWQTYNFEERKPDAIYIHNPYDDWNLVTCVHPRYFSANLKKYTEKLVYIPYFVLDEIEPDDQAKIDTMKHFVWTPGVINADKVVVQSENMRQIYINEYQKAAQANGLQGKHIDRKQLEEKFLGTGSPKFDKVLNTKKEDLEIPEEWLKIIEKSDGSWKKIIFYNTSIAALLENNEKMLEKMKDVFRIFKENKDEVALLWRPHPLIKTTVSSMRPQLWIEYEKLVKQYKEEGWGIYDDSSDVDRAVVLSDAYYGDQSSVVQVYQATNKPIMVANPSMGDAKSANNLIMGYDVSVTDLYLYIFSEWSNTLVEIEKSNPANVNLCNLPNEKNIEELFISWKLYDNKILFAPYNATKLYVFDIEKKQFEPIDIGLINEEKQIKGKISNIAIYENSILLFGENLHSIFVVNQDDYSVRRLNNYVDLLMKDGVSENTEICVNQGNVINVSSFLLSTDYVNYDNKFYFPMRFINYVVVLDMHTLQFELLKIDEKNEPGGFVSIQIENNKLYIYGQKNIFVIDFDEGKEERYSYQVINKDNFGLRKIIKHGNRLFVFYQNRTDIQVVELNGQSIRVLEVIYPNTYRIQNTTYEAWGGIGIYENNIYMQSRVDGIVFKLNMQTLVLDEMKVHIKSEILDKYIIDKMKSKQIYLQENKFISFNDWINYI